MITSEPVLSHYPHVEPLHMLKVADEKTLHGRLKEKDEMLEAKYNISASQFLYTVCAPDVRKKIIINTVMPNVKTILKVVSIASTIGAAVGFGVGHCAVQSTLVCTGPLGAWFYAPAVSKATLVGAGIGLAAGVCIAAPKCTKNTSIQILESTEFNDWKNGLTKERYDLYWSSLKVYATTHKIDLSAFECMIALDIPSIPVLAPDGRVYDKEHIERHLTNAWARVQALRDSNATEARIAEQMLTVAPLRTAPFTKEQLVYATDFAKKAVASFVIISDRLKIDPDQDPILADLVRKLYDHYCETEKVISIEIVSQFSAELGRLGASEKIVTGVLAAYQRAIGSNQQ